MKKMVQSNESSPTKDLTTSQLRHRRNQIIRDLAQDEHDHQVVKDHVTQAGNNSKVLMIRIYVVVGTALIVTVFAALNQIRPRFLFDKKPKTRPFYLGTLYPTNVVLDRDLPRFFRSYSIETPENEPARMAVKKVAKSRSNLKDPRIKVILKAWDEPHIQRLILHNVCGPEFAEEYNLASGTFERQQDLLMWCLLGARIVEGFFGNDVDILESPIVFQKKRGVIARKPDQPRISSSFFVLPRTINGTAMVSPLPWKVFDWVLANNQAEYESRDQYVQSLEEYIYEQVTVEGIDHYMTLDIDCANIHSNRGIARHCPVKATNRDGTGCCDFLLPLSEGGNLHDDDEKKDQDGAKVKSYLRP